MGLHKILVNIKIKEKERSDNGNMYQEISKKEKNDEDLKLACQQRFFSYDSLSSFSFLCNFLVLQVTWSHVFFGRSGM